MSGISGMFNTGKLALFANQTALSVTSQNIANADTEGYSRQQVTFGATIPLNTSPGQIGTGVEVKEIRRVIDSFIENQVTTGEANYGRLRSEVQVLQRVELAFTDGSSTGMNQAITEFFNAVQDLANSPSDGPARTQMLERAKTLAQQFVSTDTQFRSAQRDANKQIVGVMTEINQFASQVADLNTQIKNSELQGQNANDLRDERQVLINDISERIDIKTIESTNGEVTIFVGGGKALVEGANSGTLVGVVDTDNDGFVNVSFNPGDGTAININSRISNGKLKGLITARDTDIPNYLNRLDKLAAGIVNEFNQQHIAGYDSAGSQGTAFFTTLSPTASVLSANTGSAVVSAAVSTAASLTLDDYVLSYSSSTNYTLTNSTTGTASTPGTLPLTFEGLTISLTSGTVADGDTFNITAHKNTAQAMGVAITDPDLIAASSTATGIPGNNVNANALAAIQENAITELGSETLQSYYGDLVGTVGSRTQGAERGLDIETTLRTQLENLRQETSGVSMDEELANIIKFQRSFEAAARIIRTADEMFQTILAMRQ